MNYIPQTVLSEFKGNIRKLNVVVESLTKVWDNPAYIMLNILLQNLGADCHGAANVTIQSELTECENIVDAINELAKYSNIHLISWVYQEVSCLYTGHIVMHDNY